jgi:hypothetical protein
MNLRTKVFASALVLVLAALCFQQSPVVNSQSTFTEGFEAGGKTSYAAATVQLTSGQWYMQPLHRPQDRHLLSPHPQRRDGADELQPC